MTVYTGGYRLYSSNGGTTWATSDEATLYFKVEGTKVACTAWTTESDCTDDGCYWYNDSCHADPFFVHETFRSGYLRRFQNRQIFGHYSASGGGDLRGVAVNQSGHVYVDVEIDVSSGLHIIQESGAFVQISGQHVYVESGIWIAGLSFSGLDIQVNISGDPVIISGQPVDVSGSHVYVESGVYLASGLAVVQESGAFVQISGQHVYVESGVYLASGLAVTVESGLHTWISGQHVYVESGVYLASGLYLDGAVSVSGNIVSISGNIVEVASGASVIAASECASIIRTARLVSIIGGSSGTYLVASSGGESLCNGSGMWCSGLVHTLTVKNMDGNEDMFIGGSGCRPYSGWGYVLGGNETHTFDVCAPCNVYACAVLSGERLSWIGTDY